MLTIALEAPGKFIALPDEPAPSTPPGHALVRIHRIGVCGTDLHAYRGRQPFFNYPRILGHELGVEVIEPGDPAAGLKRGDRCSVEPYMNCGRCVACRRGKPNCCTQLKVLGVHTDGGMRPLITVPAHKLHPSATLSYDQLALVETLGIGAHAVERAGLEPGEGVLVIGAGPIGLSVIQFAQAAGARVAVMDTSANRLEFCRKQLKVDVVIDATSPDADAQVLAHGDGEGPTAVFDATGNAASMMAAFKRPAAGGKLIFVGLVQGELTFNDPEFHRKELTIFASRNARPETMRAIIAAIEAGKIDTSPWITHRLELAEVPEKFAGIAADPTLLKAMISVPEHA
jgi:2-desacetyl-2-hydroxyethyl bacteriochlorophyllide A dehydrogenase